MKNILSTLVILLTASVTFAALSIEGTYQGKNLYVQNPIDDEGFGYCATKVTVNGKIMSGGTEKSAFEIDFSSLNITYGKVVFIVIEHHEGKKPKIINPEVLLPKSTFDISAISVSTAGKLTWSTTAEQGQLPYIIEQYRWNKWVAIGEVQGVGTSRANSYEFEVTPHSGLNTVRVVQIDNTGSKRTSKEVEFQSMIAAVVKSSKNGNKDFIKDFIDFTSNGSAAETRYEIYDTYGNIVKKGVGSSVSCEKLLSGVYYINFDNMNEKFIKY